MLITRMDLLNYQYLDKMNNNIGRLHYEDESGLTGESRMQPMTSSMGSSRTGPPPVSPSKRKYIGERIEDRIDCDNEHVTKMSRLFAAQLRAKASNGDNGQDPWSHGHSPFEYPPSAINNLHGNLVYAPMPIFAMDQPLALTKNSVDTGRTNTTLPGTGLVERQQNRPSVITCAPASNRSCNLSHCHMSHDNCNSNSNSKSKANANLVCDPVIEEHFRRSLGKIYKEPEPANNSVSITGSVDDHFAKALGETWHQIKAKGSDSRSPKSSS